MKIAIILNKNKLSGKLTKFWTGCYAYHVGFVDSDSDTFYDMNLLPRKTKWTEHNYDTILLYDCSITVEQCENFLKQDGTIRYGVIDYMLFALRPLYHLFGKSTRNAKGMICSEMLNVWLRRAGEITPWEIQDEPPSPCNWLQYLNGR